MAKFLAKAALAACLLSPIAAAPAAALPFLPDIAVAPRASTLGIGGELTVKVLPWVNLRGGGYTFDFDYSSTFDDIDYDFDLGLQSGALYAEIVPFKKVLRLVAGVVINRNDLSASAQLVDGTFVDIGDPTTGLQTSFSAADVGALTAVANFERTTPYFGIGLGNPVSDGFPVTFLLDVGVLVQSTPTVDLVRTGGIGGELGALIDEQVAAEQLSFQDDLNDVTLLRFFPVVSIGIAVRF